MSNQQTTNNMSTQQQQIPFTRQIGSIDREGYIRYIERDCPKGHKTVWSVDDDGFMMYKYELTKQKEEEEEEELVRRECFKCDKIYYDVDYSCCCGKCCSYCREPDKKEEEEILSWEDQIGFPTGIYNSFKEMINGEFGDDSDEVPYDYDKMFREAVELNKE